MNVAVLVKIAVDTSYLKLDQAGRVVFEENPLRVSDIDRNAVEEAVKLKQAGAVQKISVFSVLTWGSLDKRLQEAQNVMREVLAMGADEAYILADPSMILQTHLYTAKALASMVKRAGSYELILAGEASIDDYSSQVPCRVAEELGFSCITYARRLEVRGGEVVVERDLEDFIELVKARLPAVVSVTREANVPRLPTLLQIRMAMKKPINILRLSDLEMGQPPRVHERVVEGLKIQRKNIIIEGKSMEEKVEKLLELLSREGIQLVRR